MGYCIWKSYKLKIDPIKIFQLLQEYPYCFFLDSGINGVETGRYSFLGSDPFFVLRADGRDAFGALRKLLNQYRLPRQGVPFSCGAVGYLSYDAGFMLEEKLKRRLPDELSIPGCVFGFYNIVIAVDHFKNRLHICSTGFPEKHETLGRLLARKNLDRICKLLCRIQRKTSCNRRLPEAPAGLKINSNFSRQQYLSAVKRIKEYIGRGDVYQVNLSQRFRARSSMSAGILYERLRKISPAPFCAYFDAAGMQILSSSPERFISLIGDRVITRPMKGTRARSEIASKDRIMRRQLLKSAKDKAELVMIVDLERNDLGRVCNYGSIKARRLRELETYNTVYQATATVEGRLVDGNDRIDLLRACFPGGSITGAPKIRAMEIIEELEPSRRDIYTGSLGYLSYCGNMDFNILIRTILKKGMDLYFSSGGGIVADSKPMDEYKETLVKAKAMTQAIGGYF